MTYRVTLKDNGKSFEVEEGQPVLDAALFHGVALPYGCQSGGCGACRARVVEGEVTHIMEPFALDPEEVRDGHVLLCQAVPLSDLELKIEELPTDRAIQVRNLPARVEDSRLLCHDVMALYLRLPRSERLDYLAGQYIDLQLEGGRRRSFSLANPSGEDLLELHVRRVPGGRFSEYVFEQMPAKHLLRFEGPLGNFYLREDSERPIALIAGGTGLAPIKAMIEYALVQDICRPMRLFWGVRARRDLYLDEQVRQWARAHPNFGYTPVLSAPRAQDDWDGEIGFVHDVAARLLPELNGWEVYMSGPPAMISAGSRVFTAQGLPQDRLYSDTFDYAYETWPGREQA